MILCKIYGHLVLVVCRSLIIFCTWWKHFTTGDKSACLVCPFEQVGAILTCRQSEDCLLGTSLEAPINDFVANAA